MDYYVRGLGKKFAWKSVLETLDDETKEPKKVTLSTIGPPRPLIGYPRHERMSTAKDTVREMLDELPESASLEDIQYHIYVREKVERGIEDVRAGRVVDQAEAERRLAKWLGP